MPERVDVPLWPVFGALTGLSAVGALFIGVVLAG
jgi:hypothetical protein